MYQSENTNELFRGSTWFQMNMSFYILELLCRLPIEYFDQLWAAFDKTIRGTFKHGADYTVNPIVKMVFEEKRIDEVSPNFTSEQRRVLTTIWETDNLWIESDGNTSIAFRNWGLERNRELLKRLLE